MKGRRIITLLTDFSWQDGYIGGMKGVILSINPDCQLVDLAHQIPRHDVLSAALIIGQAYPFYPPGSIHVAVVDPGVGGKRRPIVIAAGGQFFVGPDNGTFTLVLNRHAPIAAYEITAAPLQPRSVSSTFHGRDIFAPCAAYLSLDTPPDAIGHAIDPAGLVRLPIPQPTRDGSDIIGEVLWVDAFGNLVTNIPREDLFGLETAEAIEIEIGGEKISGIKRSYEEGKDGEVISLWGSAGLLEIAIREQDLHKLRGWGRGERVIVRRRR